MNIKTNARIILKILLCIIIIAVSGCGIVSFSSKAPDISFVKGELHSAINKNLDTVWKAAQKVAEESQFVVKSTRIDAFSAVLKCEDAQARKIDVTLEKELPQVTRVKVRVGLLGDAELSAMIFEQIREKAIR